MLDLFCINKKLKDKNMYYLMLKNYLKSIISNVIKNIMPIEIPKPLGRWKIENCNKKVNDKIDLSNEDHCGPCGQYALDKIKNVQSKKQFKVIYLPKSKKI